MGFLTFMKHTQKVELIYFHSYVFSQQNGPAVSTEALSTLMNNAQEEREPERKWGVAGQYLTLTFNTHLEQKTQLKSLKKSKNNMIMNTYSHNEMTFNEGKELENYIHTV